LTTTQSRSTAAQLESARGRSLIGKPEGFQALVIHCSSCLAGRTAWRCLNSNGNNAMCVSPLRQGVFGLNTHCSARVTFPHLLVKAGLVT